MKKMKIPFLFLISAAGLIACQKENSVTQVALEASKTSSIKRGEPVVFILPQAPAGSTVQWSVSPNTNTQINTSGNQASILFGSKGSYRVTAISANITASREVTVSDSTYTGGGNTGGTPASTLPFSAGETIKINLSRIDSGMTAGLGLAAITTNSYTCLNNSLLSTLSTATNSYSIDYTGVYVPADCTSGTAKAAGFNHIYPVSIGTNNLTIKVNGTVYSGTIVKSGNQFTIHWPYTTGVTISPTSL
jgi:hypothetical protein